MHRGRLLAQNFSTAVLPHSQVSKVSAGISVFLPDLSGDVEQIWDLDGSQNSPLRNAFRNLSSSQFLVHLGQTLLTLQSCSANFVIKMPEQPSENY